MKNNPKDIYLKRSECFASYAAKLNLACQKAVSWRIGSFSVFFLLCVALFWKMSFPKWIIFIPTCFTLVIFIKAVKKHRSLELRKKRCQRLANYQQIGIERIERNWDKLPLPEIESANSAKEEDLLIAGHASLIHLIGTPKTALGKDTLLSWLNSHSDSESIQARQEAIKECSKLNHFRSQLQHLTENLHENPKGFHQFLLWAKSPAWWHNKSTLKFLSILFPALVVLGLFLHFLTPYKYLWLPGLIINLMMSRFQQNKIHEGFNSVMTHEGSLMGYSSLFKLISRQNFKNAQLKQWLAPIQAEQSRADEALKQLDRILSFADLKRSELAHMPFQAILLWDLHVLKHLDAWKQSYGDQLEAWLEALAHLEALCALSILAYENPSWCWPNIRTAEQCKIDSVQLGHPLIKQDDVVFNDFSLGPQSHFTLITGSNMSGKSTLLRALGINMVLAMSGAPVCAASFDAPLMQLGTSFRIRDALDQGVSYFMAELLRLKEIVDMCDDPNDKRPLLYLFDEILLGTNIEERQVAVKMIIEHLLKKQAIGAIATHDLSLAGVEAFQGKCHCIHFRESVEEGKDGMQMTFDYQLREGVVQTSNALKLLEMVGLPHQQTH